MTVGIAGSSIEAELAAVQSMREGVVPISNGERRQRIKKAQSLMRDQDIDTLYL